LPHEGAEALVLAECLESRIDSQPETSRTRGLRGTHWGGGGGL